MGLRIDSQPALVGMNIKFPKVDFILHASKVNRDPGKAEVKIESKPGRVVVDNHPPREAIGFYDYSKFAKKAADEGQATALAGIKRRVVEGFMMADIHKNGCVIPKLAEKAARGKQLQIEVKATPPAKVTYEKGFLNIRAQIKPDKYAVSFSDFELDVAYGNVDIYLRQKDYLEITWVGDSLHIFG